MSIQFRRSRAVIRCDICPGQPVLPTPDANVDTRRCIRCQGRDRSLPIPHPSDHLCTVCQRECPGCRALTATENTLCLACRGRCRVCRRERTPRATAEPERIELKDRKDGAFRRYEKVYWPQTWDQDLCDACAAPSRHPLQAALAALPEKLIRACGGTAPRRAVDTIQAELAFRTPVQLAERIERRWWGGWASRPLQRESDGTDDGYGPDDVAVWLVAPNPCRARCEDGWQPDDPGRLCPACRGTGAHRRAERDDEDDYPEQREQRDAAAKGADRTVAQAVAARPPHPECDGRDGACGRPAAPGHTRCPVCLDWPLCDECGRRRRDPAQGGRGCGACTGSIAGRPAEEPGAGPPDAGPVGAGTPVPECDGRDGACGRPPAPNHTRCPACLDWPWCGCGRRRYDPTRNRRCRNCREPDLPPA